MTRSLAILATALLFGGMTLYSFGFAAFLFKDALHNSTRGTAPHLQNPPAQSVTGNEIRNSLTNNFLKMSQCSISKANVKELKCIQF